MAQLVPGAAVPRLHMGERFPTIKQQGSSPFSILMPGTPDFKMLLFNTIKSFFFFTDFVVSPNPLVKTTDLINTSHLTELFAGLSNMQQRTRVLCKRRNLFQGLSSQLKKQDFKELAARARLHLSIEAPMWAFFNG